jgi:hypothetical protein
MVQSETRRAISIESAVERQLASEERRGKGFSWQNQSSSACTYDRFAAVPRARSTYLSLRDYSGLSQTKAKYRLNCL